MRRSLKQGINGEKEVSTLIQSDSSYHRQLDNVILVGGSGMTHQIDHIDIRNNGVFCIETKNIPGEISGSIIDNSWTQKVMQKGQVVKRLFHNPLKQNDAHRKILQRYLGDKYVYIPIVVFASNNIRHLNIPDVINACDLQEYLSTYDTGVNYSKRQIDAIYDKLLKYKSSATEEQHLKNIKNQKEENRINKQLTIQCLKQGICPKCGSPLREYHNGYTCSSLYCRYAIDKISFSKIIS